MGNWIILTLAILCVPASVALVLAVALTPLGQRFAPPRSDLTLREYVRIFFRVPPRAVNQEDWDKFDDLLTHSFAGGYRAWEDSAPSEREIRLSSQQKLKTHDRARGRYGSGEHGDAAERDYRADLEDGHEQESAGVGPHRALLMVTALFGGFIIFSTIFSTGPSSPSSELLEQASVWTWVPPGPLTGMGG
jgi:hypothetical protein